VTVTQTGTPGFDDTGVLKTLDVGCGTAKENGAFGLDQFALPGVDLACDLNQPWPLADGRFDRVVFRHSIVHLASLEHALREARRVVRKGGIVEIISPHFSSDNAFTDPTMRFVTGWRTMDYYCSNGSMIYGYYGQVGLRIRERRIYLYRAELKRSRHRVIAALFWPVEALLNAQPRLYEKFLCFIVRGNEIRFVLEAE
jgi:SAM-dependent methyltransferase